MQAITTVFYDGLCPLCQDAVSRCRQLLPDAAVHWFDITGQQHHLLRLGIDPGEALIELYLLTPEGKTLKGIDSYSYLLAMMPHWYYRLSGRLLRIKPLHYVTSLYYRHSTIRRLRKSHRYPPCSDCGGRVSG